MECNLWWELKSLACIVDLSISHFLGMRLLLIYKFVSFLQETALNHVKNAGLLGDGFGSTPEMCKRNLIWVVTKMQVMVDRYPTW